MVLWLKAHYPDVRILALNPPKVSELGDDAEDISLKFIGTFWRLKRRPTEGPDVPIERPSFDDR